MRQAGAAAKGIVPPALAVPAGLACSLQAGPLRA